MAGCQMTDGLPIMFQNRTSLAQYFSGIGAELGVQKGDYSASILDRSRCKKLYSIDWWNGDRGHDDSEHKATISKLRKYRERSVIIKKSFDEALPMFEDEYFDFIYIDGYAHTGQNNGKTIHDWWTKVKKGGIFGGHDYSPQFPLTVQHVDEFVEKHNLTLYTTKEKPYPSWFVLKPEENKDYNETLWQSIHQNFELRYHQSRNMRWNEETWDEQWTKVMHQFGGMGKYHFEEDQVLLDLGCGSRPALDWFLRVESHHLDPLLDDYLKIEAMKPHWENKKYLYSQPAEIMVGELAGKCDYVQCWNVLDHTYDWKAILENIVSYLKPSGKCLLGTDVIDRVSEGHGSIDYNEFWEFINENFSILKHEKDFHYRTDALILKLKDE